jgi:hypothetical protein
MKFPVGMVICLPSRSVAMWGALSSISDSVRVR